MHTYCTHSNTSYRKCSLCAYIVKCSNQKSHVVIRQILNDDTERNDVLAAYTVAHIGSNRFFTLCIGELVLKINAFPGFTADYVLYTVHCTSIGSKKTNKKQLAMENFRLLIIYIASLLNHHLIVLIFLSK